MVFTDDDLENIESAKSAGGKIWENDLLRELKTRIKQYYRTNLEEVCCYCRRDLTDEFNMVIDVEHILPKSKYGEFMFEIGNLNISCKRCNMEIKREKDDFVVDTTSIRVDYTKPELYHFIHPNFEIYKDNMDYFRVDVNGTRITKFSPKTEKGTYTYNYFQLCKLEINSLNEAQGISTKNDGGLSSDKGTDEIRGVLEMLLSKL
jgi:hypothetical protein